MSALHKILRMIEESSFSNKDIAEKLGLNQQVVTDWRAGRSKSYEKYLYQIAEILNTTPEYLRGETDIKEKPSLERADSNNEDIKLLAIYNRLNDEGRAKLLDYADDLDQSGKYKKDRPLRVGSTAV